MMVTTYGDIGSGKTTLLSIFALDSNKPQIFSNFKIDIPNYHKLTHTNLFELPDNIDVFIDEAYAWLESRRSSKDINILASHILFQSRKTFTNIFVTIQLLSALDLRFREMSDVLIKCVKHDNFQLFEYIIYVKCEGSFVYNKTKLLPFENATKHFKIFDTYEIVDNILSEKYRIQAIINNPTKLKNEIKDTAIIIKKYLKANKPTHANISLALIDLNYSKDYINSKIPKYIHAYLTQNLKK